MPHPAGHTSVPRGVTTTYTYNDHDSLLTDVAYSDSTPAVHYSNFDAYGRAQMMTDGTGTQTFTYDDDDDLTGKTVTYTGLPARSLSYTFYNDGSRHTMGTPAGTFTYTYDGDGRITGITDPSSTASSWTYYNNDWLNTQHLGSAVTNSYTYNAAGQITAQTNAPTGGTAFNVGSYHYDGVGNLLGYTATSSGSPAAGTYSYTYDSKDEVTGEVFAPSSGGTAYNHSYAYDGAGNPTTFRNQSGLTFNADNQPTGTSLTFDGDGNTTYDGGSAVTWNGADQMTGWGSLGNAKYDGFGMRAVRTAGSPIYSLYDGDTPVCALDSSGNVLSTYTMGPTGMADFNASSYGTRMETYDPRGNAVQTVSSAGVVLSSPPSVDAYGQSGSSPILFDTQDTFPTNQAGSGPNALALGFRDYDTTTGRFLKRDPMGYGGGINLYSYTQNNPVNSSDPSGLSKDDPYDFTEGPIPQSSLQDRDPNMVQAGFDAGSSIVKNVPVVGEFLMGYDAITGCDPIAMRHLSPLDRVFEGVLAAAPCLQDLRFCKNGGCFVAGTPVQMADGSTKPIEQVQQGDLVMSRDPQTGQTQAKPVTATFVHEHAGTLTLTFSDGDQITTTPEHPFFVDGKGFTPAGQLAIGTSIVTRAGPVTQVTGSTSSPATVPVYNFTVADDHTYFVGTQDGGEWVHNACLYQRNFFKAHPELNPGEWVVHHAIPQRVFRRYPGLFNNADRDALENLRGIRKGKVNNDIHLGDIGALWMRFYKYHPNPTRADVERLRDFIDFLYSSHFVR